MALSRRDLLKFGAVLAASNLFASPENGVKSRTTATHKKEKAKVVIVGGGWSGLSVAKHLKRLRPDLKVTLIEKRSHFISCPLSNLWLVGVLDLEFLVHDYLQAASNNGYEFVNATVYDIDRKVKKVKTTHGEFDYDFLVLAPGIDYDYSELTGGDRELESILKRDYPAGFIPGSEHLSIKRKLEEFEGGNFLLTVPGGNYRCLPAPYERAALMAWYFKNEGIKAKVVLVDENPAITIKAKGFGSAFEELYKEYIEYLPGSKIVSVDPSKKRISTDMGDEIEFSDAAIYPKIRGAKLLEIAGVAKDSPFNKMEADIDPFTYRTKIDPYIFCSGDARPMGFSKSGNTANSEGEIVAQSLIAAIDGKEFNWRAPLTVCYSAVSAEPVRAISVNASYAYDSKNKTFVFKDASTMEEWRGKKGLIAGKAMMEWAKGMYRDMFM